MSKTALHIPSLDGLRTASFALVFVGHAGLENRVPGGFGVTTFFFLSGFLITTLMRLEERKRGTVSLKAFYLRRVLRILPPFYLVLTVATLLALAGVVPANGGGLQLRPLLALALHYGNYWFVLHGSNGVAAGTPVYWSLAVEEHFYFLFPVLYLVSRRLGLEGKRLATLLLTLCACILAWRCVLVFGSHVPADRTYLASDTRFDSILFGCALAVGFNPVIDAPRGSDQLWKRWLFPAGVALLLFTFLFRAGWFRESIRYTIQGLALLPVFVSAMRFPNWGPFRILNQKHVAFVGELTYSLYLVHHVVLYSVRWHLPTWHPILLGILALSISLVVALLMHHFVEKPFAKLRRRFSSA